jgi:ATP-dependent Zn protease
MTRLINWMNEDVRRWLVGILIATTMMLVTFVITSFTNIGVGAKRGNEAYEQNRQQDLRIKALEQCEHTQQIINMTVKKDVDEMKEDIRQIVNKTDKIYEHLLNKR